MTYDQARSHKMPCGEHEGRSLDHCPIEEVKWLAENWESTDEESESLVKAALTVLDWLEAQWQKDKENAVPKPSVEPHMPCTIEAQAFGTLKAVLDAAPPNLF